MSGAPDSAGGPDHHDDEHRIGTTAGAGSGDTPEPRRLDLVVFGASGFVGRLVAGQLAANAPVGVRIGLAGRSADRLAAVRRDLGANAAGWPLIVADAARPDTLAALATGARVVLSTVGPYARHGVALVQACAAAGTDYADLTGEVTFVRRSIDTCHEAARASGARIVHSCGFDSIPSDLGVLLLHERALADGAGALGDTTYVLTSARGGFSGGTVDSLRTELDAALADPDVRPLLSDRYSLSSDRGGEPDRDPASVWVREQDSVPVQRDDALGGWIAPFVMAGFNTRIVRRSAALQGWAYGRTFRYREVIAFGHSPAAPLLARAATAGLRALIAGLAFGPTRVVLDRVLPKPGSGPSERVRRTGHFRVEIHAVTTGGRRYLAVVAGRGDPGYAATAVMLAQAGLCLVLDRDRLPPTGAHGGVLTPATALGVPLVDRLRAAGLTFTVTGQA